MKNFFDPARQQTVPKDKGGTWQVQRAEPIGTKGEPGEYKERG